MKGNTNMLKILQKPIKVLNLDNVRHVDHFDEGDSYIAMDCFENGIQLQLYTPNAEKIAELMNEKPYRSACIVPFKRKLDGEQVDLSESKPNKIYLASSEP